MAEPHTQEAVLVSIPCPFKEDDSVWRIEFLLFELVHEFDVPGEFPLNDAPCQHVQLRGGGVEEQITLHLVAVQLSNLVLVDVGEERNPVVDEVFLESADSCAVVVEELLDREIGVQSPRQDNQTSLLVLLEPQ